MASSYTYLVETEHDGSRLDRFIEARQVAAPPKQLSRSAVQKLVREGAVTVNGNASKPGYKLRVGDQVNLSYWDAPPRDTIQPEHFPLDILYEDSDLIVVNKPANMLVHPTDSVHTGTLVNAVLAHCGNLSEIGGAQRPGIVHRLDKDTSGVLVAAKTDYAHQKLSAQFEAHTTEREYLAVGCGVPRAETGIIDAPIRRSRRDWRKMTVTEAAGRHAVTHYRVLEIYDRFALLQLNLETGRLHQIRVHLSHFGHPVAGDSVYGGGRQRALRNAQSASVAAAFARLNRQALHAHTLGFNHPKTDERVKFSAPMPMDMQRVVDALREYAGREGKR